MEGVKTELPTVVSKFGVPCPESTLYFTPALPDMATNALFRASVAHRIIFVKARRLVFITVIALAGLIEVSCGGSTLDPKCVAGIRVSPISATADHLLPAPGNQQQFLAFPDAAPGCVVPQAALTSVTWSVSDTQDATISNASGATFGTATCRNSTPNPVTVTAMLASGGQMLSGSASLSCR